VSTDRPVRLSTVVMAHPQRGAAARRLRDSYPELGIEVVYDPDPDGPPATLRAARLAWGKVTDGATHHLVLQDDVELCDDFARLLYRAAETGPAGPLSLFANWASRSGQMVRLAALSGATWAPVLDPYVPTQALMLPAQLAREFAVYAQGLPFTEPDNLAMSSFLAGNGLTTYVSCPNLVEHVGTDSLLWHDVMFGIRSSVLFPGEDKVLPETFDDSVVESQCVPHFESLAGFAVVFFQDALAGESAGSRGAHEVLRDCGMSNSDIVELFRAGLRENPQVEPQASGFGYPFIFQLWLTAFVFGTVASQLLGGPHRDALDAALEREWARRAIATLPAGTLRRFTPVENLTATSARLMGLCTEGIRAGFVAPARWPELLTFPERLGKSDSR
jgi:hypothetical protein